MANQDDFFAMDGSARCAMLILSHRVKIHIFQWKFWHIRNRLGKMRTHSFVLKFPRARKIPDREKIFFDKN